jgi:large subunit ribosomal protein L22
MEIRSVAKSVRISPRKVRLVADSVSKLPVDKALRALLVTQKRAGKQLRKTLVSALANAAHNNQIQKEELKIQRILVTEGPVFKRFHPSTRGRIHPYKKRSSHITVILTRKGEGA